MTDDLLNPPQATPGDEGHLHLTLSPNDAPDAAPHGRLILHAHEPDGDSRPESDAEVVAGVRSLFGGGSDAASAPSSAARKPLPSYARAQVPHTADGAPLGRAGTATAGRPLPPTGRFHKPVPQPAASAPTPPSQEPIPPADPDGVEWDDDDADTIPLSLRLRAWWAGIDASRKLIGSAVLLFVLVALVAVASVHCSGPADESPIATPPSNGPGALEGEVNDDALATTQSQPPSSGTADAAAGQPAEPPAVAAQAPADLPPPATPASAAPTPLPPPAEKPAPLPALAIPGFKVSSTADGYLLVFEQPAFESLDYLSVSGMKALKTLGARLKALKKPLRVTLTGYTDNVPMSHPTDKFKSNADIAAARAAVATDHLRHFANNDLLSFEALAGPETEAPFPNDTPASRRLNRTVTIRLAPAQ